MQELTKDERKAVVAAVRSSLQLRQRHLKLVAEDKKMERKQTRFKNKEIPALKSALSKLRLLIMAALLAAAATASAAPSFSVFTGGELKPGDRYAITYDAPYGGHWRITGKVLDNHDGTFTDKFRGTVSDPAAFGTTITHATATWTGDSQYLLTGFYRACIPFVVSIDRNGKVEGRAEFRP